MKQLFNTLVFAILVSSELFCADFVYDESESIDFIAYDSLEEKDRKNIAQNDLAFDDLPEELIQYIVTFLRYIGNFSRTNKKFWRYTADFRNKKIVPKLNKILERTLYWRDKLEESVQQIRALYIPNNLVQRAGINFLRAKYVRKIINRSGSSIFIKWLTIADDDYRRKKFVDATLMESLTIENLISEIESELQIQDRSHIINIISLEKKSEEYFYFVALNSIKDHQ